MNLEILEQQMKDKWASILKDNALIQLIQAGINDRRLYVMYLAETYHYASHNAKNQAIVAQKLKTSNSKEINYMKYCLEHALEETGHELMAYHDLKVAGCKVPLNEMPAPLPETETFIGYLYYVAQNGNPLRRLGYSYWAEDSYAHFGHVMMTAAQNMKLSKAMMTFFSEHSDIDEKHSDDVNRMIKSMCKTDEDWNEVSKVMLQTLELTGQMLTAIANEYKRVLENKSVWNKIFETYGEELNQL
jgi:hypothetical protein